MRQPPGPPSQAATVSNLNAVGAASGAGPASMRVSARTPGSAMPT